MIPGWPFDNLVPFSYDLVEVDPPWSFAVWGDPVDSDRHAAGHYDLMSLAEIMDLPVRKLFCGAGLLVLWCHPSMPRQALAVLDAWNIRESTTGVWVKTTRLGTPAIGCGYRLRNSHEPFILAAVGTPDQGTRAASSVIETFEIAPEDWIIRARRREHSRKPDELYERLEAVYPAARRRCRLFARSERPGWDSWGREVGTFEEHES